MTISKAIEAHVYKRESDEFRAWIGKTYFDFLKKQHKKISQKLLKKKVND